MTPRASVDLGGRPRHQAQQSFALMETDDGTALVDTVGDCIPRRVAAPVDDIDVPSARTDSRTNATTA